MKLKWLQKRVLLLQVILSVACYYSYFPFSNHTVSCAYNPDPIPNKRRVIFFCPDVHDGTRRDLAFSLYHLNQSIVFSSYKCSLPKYSRVHSMEMTTEATNHSVFPSIVIADANTCRRTPFKQFDEAAAHHSFSLFKEYSLSSSVDAIICSFYPAECLNYVTTNKTVVFLPAHRFLLLLCKSEQVNAALFWMFHSGLPNIQVIAMGEYDKEYINYYTGKEVPFLYPSSFFEYSAPQIRRNLFDEVLVAPFHPVSDYYSSVLNGLALKQHYNITFTSVKRKINGSFTFDDLNRFPIVVVFPYAVLSYYLSDIIASAIPMIVPSRQYISMNKGLLSDYRNQDRYYCNGTAIMPERSNASKHILSPEANTPESRYYWSQYASFYTPCVTTFHSMDEIPGLVERMNVNSVYECNLKFIEEMKKHNRREWLRLFRRIHPRTTANDYSDVLALVNRSSVYQ